MTGHGARLAAGVAALAVMISAPAGAADCGLCASEVTMTSSLAACFLADYAGFASKREAVIVVDLTGCETDRGIVEALPAPTLGQPEPDTQFILSKVQLDCLKHKLEQPGLVLDPAARIELDRCR